MSDSVAMNIGKYVTTTVRTVASRSLIAARSHHHHHGVLDQGLERADELGPERTVDRAVIGGESDRHDMRGFDLAVAHDRALLAGADRENGRMRRIDDG